MVDPVDFSEQPTLFPVDEIVAEAPLERQHVLDTIDRWFAVGFPGSPVTQTAEQWNHLQQKIKELKELF